MDKTNIIDLIKKIGEAAANMPNKEEKNIKSPLTNSVSNKITVNAPTAFQKGLVTPGQIAKPQKKTLTKQAIIDLIVRHNILSKQIDDKLK